MYPGSSQSPKVSKKTDNRPETCSSSIGSMQARSIIVPWLLLTVSHHWVASVRGACVRVPSSPLAAVNSSTSTSSHSAAAGASDGASDAGGAASGSSGGVNVSAASPHVGWRLAFCGPAPAAVWVALNASDAVGNASAVEAAVVRQDARAAADFAKMLRVLSTFDCSRKYSYFTCDQCRAYYKRWICLMRLPRCTMGPDDAPDRVEPDPPCLDSCTDVLRACPYNIDFSCPSAQSLFGHDYSIETSTCDAGIQSE